MPLIPNEVNSSGSIVRVRKEFRYGLNKVAFENEPSLHDADVSWIIVGRASAGRLRIAVAGDSPHMPYVEMEVPDGVVEACDDTDALFAAPRN